MLRPAHRATLLASSICLLWLPLRAETAWIPADRDTTLIEDSRGALSNGAGPVVHVGRTNQSEGAIRRGLLRFDIASALPPRAIVEAVTLYLTALPGNAGTSPIRVHRLLDAWGEGASYSEGGRGGPSEPGDATWIHTFFDSEFWEYAGGHFVGTPSAEFDIDGPGEYLVTGSQKLLADARLFRAAPSRNFGWILIGDETRPQSVQPFASRENPENGVIPMLEIVYRTAGRSRGLAAARFSAE